MTHSSKISHDDAREFFDELLTAYSGTDAARKAYASFGRTMHRLLDTCTSIDHVRFVGTFAKLDYLLKRHGASSEMASVYNQMRTDIASANRDEMDDKEMSERLPMTFKTLCTLVAFLSDAAIPSACSTLFTPDTERLTHHRKRLDRVTEYRRMVVSHWDDTFIYGSLDSEAANVVKVCYAKDNENYPYDRSYLSHILTEGTQLNLIRPRIEDGIIYPELIIYEPDCLIDISSIASCFETYGATPVSHLLNKLRPNVQTTHTVMGNLASQMLDDQVRNGTAMPSYGSTALAFMRANSLALLTTDLSKSFHADAQVQQRNIHEAIANALPRLISGYDPDKTLLEPSFFSEMLGLQGRMDLLQMDFSILMEQKSGKCGFPQRDPDTPTPAEKHYVQMLLYMAVVRYNFRKEYEHNGRALQAMLLYSKYRNSLLPLGSAPELLFNALRMRNLIVSGERGIEHDGAMMLDTLTADSLNAKGTHGRLWIEYQKPQIEDLLRPIMTSSPLERAYYHRFIAFIEKEHLLSKLGSETKEGSGFAAKWHDSLDEKLQAGNICTGMKLTSPTATHTGSVDEIRLRFSEEADNGMANFRRGDIVVLYPYTPGSIPDVRRVIVHRCSIARIDTDGLTLRLRAPQSNARAFTSFADESWAVEHDFFESSYTPLYRAMHSFLSAPKPRRDLIMLQRQPQVDETLRLNGDYGAFNELSKRVKQSRDMFLIIGPPGTGKTSYGLLNTLKEELTEPEGCVLLLSFTNRAVDEICSKLTEDGIDFIRMGSELSCSEAYHEHLLSSIAGRCANIAELRHKFAECRVVVGTTAALNSGIQVFNIKQFSLAIIDEASQILEPHIIGLLSATHDGEPAIGRFVMIGDHKQLPAVVQQRQDESAVSDEGLNGIMLTDCRLSLFERMLKRYGSDPRVCYMLRKQGRMHPDIARFPNREFYGGMLQPVPLPHQRGELSANVHCNDELDLRLSRHRVMFIDVPTPDDSPSDKVNVAEARVIADIVGRVRRMTPDFDATSSIGVIVPYRNQITAVRNAVDSLGMDGLKNITIDTVERYQGSQCDCIVYGFTVQRRYQLGFLTNNCFTEDGHVIDRKLNVAMTRARERLIMVGSRRLLSQNEVFKKLTDEYCL